MVESHCIEVGDRHSPRAYRWQKRLLACTRGQISCSKKDNNLKISQQQFDVLVIWEQEQIEASKFHGMQKSWKKSVYKWRQNAWDTIEEQCDWECDNVCGACQPSDQPLQNTYSLTCILFISLQFSSQSFAFYELNLHLSTPALGFTVHHIAVEIFLKYCLFWSTWFNLLFGACYSLSHYLDSL